MITSPYLRRVRSAREIVEQLIAMREVELSQTADAAVREELECALDWLRRERGRLETGSEHDGGA